MPDFQRVGWRSQIMSIPTILGILFSLGLFVWSVIISTDNYIAFIDMPSFIMVVGGTMGAVFISYEARYVINSLKLVPSIFFVPKITRMALTNEIGRVIRWGYLVQKNGMQGLEGDVGKLKGQDKFLSFGVDLVISGYTGQEVRETLNNTIESTFHRSMVPVAILKNMAANAPAFGMIGTLVGLVIMLDKMGADPGGLGKGLAIALITTLYGVLLARMVLLPAASKIQQREEILRFRNYLVAEGLALLAERKSPRYIQDRMNSYLDPSLHFNIDKHMKK
jgi:chemotaxis protein MotA